MSEKSRHAEYNSLERKRNSRTQEVNIFSAENIRNCERYVFSIQQRLDRAVATNDVKCIRHIFDLLTKRSQVVKILKRQMLLVLIRKPCALKGTRTVWREQGTCERSALPYLNFAKLWSK